MSASTGWGIFTLVMLVLVILNSRREKRRVTGSGVARVILVGRADPAPSHTARNIVVVLIVVGLVWFFLSR